MLKTLKTKIKKFKNHFSCSFLSFSLHKIHFSATKQSHTKRKKMTFFFSVFSFFSWQQNNLKHTEGHKIPFISSFPSIPFVLLGNQTNHQRKKEKKLKLSTSKKKKKSSKITFSFSFLSFSLQQKTH